MTILKSKTVRIGLLGMYTSRNLGDVAIQYAIMNALRKRREDIEFVGLCQDPEDTVRAFGIPAVASTGFGSRLFPAYGAQPVPPAQLPPARSTLPSSTTLTSGAIAKLNKWLTELRTTRILRQIIAVRNIRREMQSLDMLLVSGSGQVDDYWGGPWGQPFRLMAWTSAAHSQGKPVAVFGVGVDELSTRLGGLFCVQALRKAQLCVLRDSGSRDAIRSLGFRGQMEICADPAFSLRRNPAGTPGDAEFVVISPIARSAWPGAEDEAYGKYLGAMSAVADYLLQQSIPVRFVCSQTRMDPKIVGRIRQRMLGNAASTLVVEVNSFEEYLDAVQGALVVVGSRLHALILALVAGTPVIAVTGVRKVHQLFADLNLSDHAFEMRSLSVELLLARINSVIRDPRTSREHVRGKTLQLLPPLERQFDNLAMLVPALPSNY